MPQDMLFSGDLTKFIVSWVSRYKFTFKSIALKQKYHLGYIKRCMYDK